MKEKSKEIADKDRQIEILKEELSKVRDNGDVNKNLAPLLTQIEILSLEKADLKSELKVRYIDLFEKRRIIYSCHTNI